MTLPEIRAYLAAPPREQTHGQTLIALQSAVDLLDDLEERLALVLLKVEHLQIDCAIQEVADLPEGERIPDEIVAVLAAPAERARTKEGAAAE